MSRPIVYVSCAQRCEIQRFELSPDTGALHLLGATPVPGIQGPSDTSMPLAASPDRRVLHAALRGAPHPCVSFVIAAVLVFGLSMLTSLCLFAIPGLRRLVS